MRAKQIQRYICLDLYVGAGRPLCLIHKHLSVRAPALSVAPARRLKYVVKPGKLPVDRLKIQIYARLYKRCGHNGELFARGKQLLDFCNYL